MDLNYIKDIVKDLDGGKILGAVDALPKMIDTKALQKKIDNLRESPLTDKIDHTIRLGKDIATWPVNYVEGLVGAVKTKFEK